MHPLYNNYSHHMCSYQIHLQPTIAEFYPVGTYEAEYVNMKHILEDFRSGQNSGNWDKTQEIGVDKTA